MSIIVDVIIVLIIAICTYRGYKKGLIGTAFAIASVIIALLVACILFTPVSTFLIEHTDFDDNIKTSIIDNFTTSQESGEKSEDFISQYIEKYITETKNAGVEAAAKQISVTAMNLASFVGVFLVIRIGLVFFKALANFIAKLPILKQFNKLGGVLFGLIKGLIIIYIILAIMILISPMIHGTEWHSIINGTTIGELMYNNNIIIKLIF